MSSKPNNYKSTYRKVQVSCYRERQVGVVVKNSKIDYMYEVYCFGVQIICKVQRSFVTGQIKILVNDKLVHTKVNSESCKEPFYWEHETDTVKLVVGLNA